ncbi:zinc dependent phospholipase C family protein [Haloimpatiens sp. FM7330]|uniref:zinc dependent phospholipase C family protein n=1 Tax=Haloimpatiens sp. FM7330 TaxID=3298610 RepID=UPI003630939B
MRRKIEKTYGKTVKGVMHVINPLKKKIIKTFCTVHKYINIKAVEILKINDHIDEYEFYKNNIRTLNEGVMWADQDFKSTNHFYHVVKGRGLFGFSDALTECKRYYDKSILFLKQKNLKKSIFYLGAACHLIQDATVPQHVNNKLLKEHRKFEVWITSKLMNDYSFEEEKKIKRYDTIDEYIKNNAVLAYNCYKKYVNIKEKEERYEKISNTIIREAEKTTAGFLVDYYAEYKTIFPI